MMQRVNNSFLWASLLFVIVEGKNTCTSFIATRAKHENDYRFQQSTWISSLAPSISNGITSSSSSLQMGFFDNLLKDAFANDENLSSDKATGQLEYEGDDSTDFIAKASSSQQTDTQKRWLASQQKEKERKQKVQKQQVATGVIRGVKGAPVNPELLIGTTWVLDLYLAGIPDRDPSNDLYGSRVNISNRDKVNFYSAINLVQINIFINTLTNTIILPSGYLETNNTQSLSLGASIPEKPSVSVKITFEKDGVCRYVCDHLDEFPFNGIFLSVNMAPLT